jgi:uncharacterized protein with PQ loop repeat
MSNVSLLSVMGVCTFSAAVLVKFIGLPDQIRQNYRRKSTKGLSAPFFLLGLLSYLLWTAYGLLQKDWVVAAGQGAGVLTMGVIALQMWLYRDNAKEVTEDNHE